MLTIKAPDYALTFPSSWEEVTLAQFLALHKTALIDKDSTEAPEDDVRYSHRQALEAFASNADLLHRLGAAEENQIIERMTFLQVMPNFEEWQAPAEIAGAAGVPVKPPTDLGACALIQKWSIDECIKVMEAQGRQPDYMNLAPTLLGVYLYPLLTQQPFTATSQLEEVADVINRLPCTQALPLASFILRNYSTSTSAGQATYTISYPKINGGKALRRRFPNWSRLWNALRPKLGRTAGA